MNLRARFALRVFTAATAANATLARPVAAHAQTPFSVERFQPSERGSEWFSTESLDLRGHLRPAVGLVADWAYQPLVIGDPAGNVRSAVVKDQVFVHAGASLVLWDRLRASVSVPVLVFADGTTASIGTQSFAKPSSSAALGDVRIGIDARLVGVFGDRATLAAGVDVGLPTGSQGAYAGDGNVTASPRLLVAGDVGPFVYAGKLGVAVRGLDQSYGGGVVGSSVFVAASAGLRVWGRRLVVGPEVFAESGVTHGALFSSQATPVEGILGAHCLLSQTVRVGVGAATGLTSAFGTPTARGLVSVEWAPDFVPPDRDHDGVLDAVDACPDVSGVKTADPKTNGCPSDRDQDGVLDADDACPDVPGVKTADPKTNGCPADRDGDGVLDVDDACPDVPGVKTADPKTNGCPADRDGDGVLDADDACPDVPGVKTADPKTNGCPSDRDHDGVADGVDACPDEPGKPDPDPKRNGCPAAFVKDGEIKILDQVKFATGSAEIVPGVESEAVLLAVARVLEAHPEIAHVRVEGHTDDHGRAHANLRLSEGRAAAVVRWLGAHGIAKKRLTSEGFGQTRPLESNETDEGRKANRRVEFHIAGK